MIEFNVIWEDNGKFVPYNIMPRLISRYNKKENKPKTFDEFKKFIESESLYQWWCRCEYEIIITDWPSKRVEEKWDIHKQVMMNIDVITNLLMECVNSKL